MKYELAQVNIARFRVPADDPVNADFVDNLDRVNAIAETQPGFVWRLIGSGNDALDLQAFDDPLIITNLSVWTDVRSLVDFVYRNPAPQRFPSTQRVVRSDRHSHGAMVGIGRLSPELR